MIKEKVDYATKIFRLLEGFIAFGIATTIIIAASWAFPIYLMPLCVLIMGVFCFYVWGQRAKGWYFIGIIYGLIAVLTLMLVRMTIQRFIYRKFSNSAFFFPQKARMYAEYTYQ